MYVCDCACIWAWVWVWFCDLFIFQVSGSCFSEQALAADVVTLQGVDAAPPGMGLWAMGGGVMLQPVEPWWHVHPMTAGG